MKINFMTFLYAVSMFTGWLTKAAADGKIDGKEWAELALGIAGHLGISTDVILPQLPEPETTLTDDTVTAEASGEDAARDKPPPYPPEKMGTVT